MRQNNKTISASVLAGCQKAGIDPTIELLKIAKKANIALPLKVKIYQNLLKYLYPNMRDQDLLESQYQTSQLHIYNLMDKLTVEEVKRLANMPLIKTDK